MDKKNLQKNNVYDKGRIMNWYQVFGKNKWLWLLPVTGISGKPIGDGVIWTQENNNLEDEVPENEVEIRKSIPGAAGINLPLNNDNTRNTYRNLEAKNKEDNNTTPTDSFRKQNYVHNSRLK